jgi:Phage integrase family
VGAQTSRGGLRTVTVLAVACMPLAFYADVLEVALPVTLVQTLHASPAWSSGIFVGNTVLVIVLQVIVVVGLSGRSHRTVLAASGLVLAGSYLGFWLGAAWGGPPGVIVVAAVALPYTMGEILYTGSSVPLVIESAPTQLTGRALARWQLSYGLARAADPIIITGLLAISAAALWVPLTAATLLSAAAIPCPVVPRVRLHDVRHTYATIALDSGVDLKIVSERLGHANMTVTAQIYTHRSTGNDVAAAAKIAEMIFNPSART